MRKSGARALTNVGNVCFISPFYLIPFGTLVYTGKMKTPGKEPFSAALQWRWKGKGTISVRRRSRPAAPQPRSAPPHPHTAHTSYTPVRRRAAKLTFCPVTTPPLLIKKNKRKNKIKTPFIVRNIWKAPSPSALDPDRAFDHKDRGSYGSVSPSWVLRMSSPGDLRGIRQTGLPRSAGCGNWEPRVPVWVLGPGLSRILQESPVLGLT